MYIHLHNHVYKKYINKLLFCRFMINNNEIKIVVRMDNDANALNTIQQIRNLDGFKGLSFKYKE